MSDYLIIDGNNLCHRVFWTNKELSYKGTPVGLIFGFYRSLVKLKKKYPEHNFVVAWDASGSTRREEEANRGVESGLIPSGYKAKRKAKKEEEPDESIEMMLCQMSVLKESLPLTRVFQVEIEGYEADDIAYTYAKKNEGFGGSNVIVTSDKDYYQAISDKTIILDDMKETTWTRESFVVEYGFDPELWVDVGAIMGDSSDEIHGVPGWGIKTACKYVADFGNVDAVIGAIQNKEKKSKKEQIFLDHLDRIALAKSLKKMDYVPMLIPKVKFNECDTTKLRAFFSEYGFASLMHDSKWLI